MLNEKVQLLRKQSSMTQEQLAEKLDITRQTISKWELGESEPDIKYLIQLSEIFQVTTDYLLKDIPNNPPIVNSPQDKKRTLQEKAKLMVGGIFIIIGIIGVLTIWSLSVMRPVYLYHDGSFESVNGSLFGGLQNFLYAWNAQGLFWLLVIIGIVGVILIFFPNFWKDGGSAITDAEKALEKYKSDKQRVDKFLKDLDNEMK